MATGFLSPISLITQMLSDQGIVGSGFQLFLYLAGTSTPATTYTSASLGVANSNPIVMGSNGRFPNVSIWTPAGTVLKMVWEDANNNLIAGLTVDNIPAINDLSATSGGGQVTFWGGADGGVANAYTLSFTAPFFTGLTNGNVIWWVPGHTNTGASTLNVNGLGVTNITNIDGSALQAGQLTAGQIAQVIYYNGNFILQSAAVLNISGSWSSTLSGPWASGSNPTVTMKYERTGNHVTVWCDTGATVICTVSAAISASGLPAIITPSSQRLLVCTAINNQSTYGLPESLGEVAVKTNNTLLIYPVLTANSSANVRGINSQGPSGGTFTADSSNTVGINNGWSISYSM